MKIFLINGQAGTGKSSVANELKNQIVDSAFIDADSLISVNPFNFGKQEQDDLMLENALSLISNFSKAGYSTIVTSGLTRNQEQLDSFAKLLSAQCPSVEMTFVWLRADKETRMKRKAGRNRDGADNMTHFESIDKLYPDVQGLKLEKGVSMEFDTSRLSIQDMVWEILKS